MEPSNCDHKNRLISLTVITLSVSYCGNLSSLSSECQRQLTERKSKLLLIWKVRELKTDTFPSNWSAFYSDPNKLYTPLKRVESLKHGKIFRNWGKVRTSQGYHRNFTIAVISSQLYHRSNVIAVLSSQ